MTLSNKAKNWFYVKLCATGLMFVWLLKTFQNYRKILLVSIKSCKAHRFFSANSDIGIARGVEGAMALPTFLAYLVILCFERRWPKQNIAAPWKLKISLRQIWAGYATGLWPTGCPCFFFSKVGNLHSEVLLTKIYDTSKCIHRRIRCFRRRYGRFSGLYQQSMREGIRILQETAKNDAHRRF